MDYEKFKKEWQENELWDNDVYKQENKPHLSLAHLSRKDIVQGGWTSLGSKMDAVNSPAHYTRGKVEAIEIIEDAIMDAPSVKEGMLQAQVLKYLLRLWLKDNPKQDAEKAQWYLKRLIDSMAD